MTPTAGDLHCPGGGIIPGQQVALFEVRSVGELGSDEVAQRRALFEIGTEGVAIGGDKDSVIWVQITVPADARPGTYRGSIQFHADGEQAGYLPLTVQVHEPTLPDVQNRSVGVDAWQSWAHLGSARSLTTFDDAWWDLAGDYLASLAALGVRGAHLGRAFCDWRRVAAGQWQFDFSRFDRFARLSREKWPTSEISYLGMFSTSGPTQIHYVDAAGELHTVEAEPGEELYDEAWSAFAEALARHCRNAGCFGELYVWPADRPSTSQQVAQFIHCVNLLRDADPDYRIAVTVDDTQLARQLADHVDRMVLPLRGFHSPDPGLVAELKATGKQVWGYLEERPDCPGLSPGLAAVHAYAVGPLANYLQLDGILISSHPGLPAADGAQDVAKASSRAAILYVGERVRMSLESQRLLLGLQDAELMQMAGRAWMDSHLTDIGVGDDWKLMVGHATQLRLRALFGSSSSSAEH